jgi:Tol biopolymer transport system component
MFYFLVRYSSRVCGALGCLPFLCAGLLAAAQDARGLDHHWQLWKVSADGTGLARIRAIPGYECGSPKWSPDGTMIAYDTRRDNEEIINSLIAVIAADGTQPPKLLGPGGMPCWSPDGTHLVFHTYDTPQKVVVMKADGSGRETLVNHWGSPRWMPSGDRIALIGVSGNITMFNLADGGERFMITNANGSRPGFAVSPDGLKFVFGGESDGLFMATLDRRTGQVSTAPLWIFGICYHASWSPDGKRIVFGWKSYPPGKLVQESNLHQLYLFDLDKGGPPMLLSGQDVTCNNTNPDWSPDGKTIVFASHRPLQTD